jgi:hypothetical protein
MTAGIRESKYGDAGWRGASRALALDEDMLAVPSALLAWLLGA